MSDELPQPERPTADNIIRSWKVHYGEESRTKNNIPFFRIDFGLYADAINSLLQSFLAEGYKEEELDDSKVVEKIKKALTPEVHDTQKLKDWRDIIERIWYHYIDKEFANPNLVRPPKQYPKHVPYRLAAPAVKDESEPYVPPVGKIRGEDLQGFGESTAVYDDEFLKLLEDMKNE